MLVTLGIEDALSASVASRLVNEYTHGGEIVNSIGLRGNGYLRNRLRDLNQIAAYVGPVLVLTDLDRPGSCPAELVEEWTQNISPDPNLLIRVAVLEIEAWVLADRRSFAEWLRIARNRVPHRPEEVDDPKQTLVNLARRSRKRDLRDGLVRRHRDGLYRPGPDYNALLSDFVEHAWDPEAARLNSRSLDRAIRRIADMETEKR